MTLREYSITRTGPSVRQRTDRVRVVVDSRRVIRLDLGWGGEVLLGRCGGRGVFLEPERALQDGILLTPTIIKLSPLPMVRIVGTLSDPLAALRALGLAEVP